MSLHEHLRTHAREDMPTWLARHRPGDAFDRDAFFASHVVFYPGSGTDGHPVALFGSTHSAHCFVYADYGIDADYIKQQLAPTGHPFDGYRTLDRIDLQMQDLTPRGWTPHAGAQDYGFATVRPFGFVEVLEREEHKGDEHGPHRLAVLFLGADGIATYDALFCQGNGTAPPLAVVIEDYGFGGTYRGGNFGSGDLLETIARRCEVMPRWLLVGNAEPWEGFVRVPNIDGDTGGMHNRVRFLYSRIDSKPDAHLHEHSVGMYDDFRDVRRQNSNLDFDDNTHAVLQCYVYALRDPRDKRIFYIGKAGGQANQGNARVLAHFDEAETWLRNPIGVPTDKIRQIAQIWREAEAVEWFVVRHGLTEDVALDVEAALIDTLRICSNGDTSNAVRGYGAHARGLLSMHEVVALAAPPVNPNNRVRVFVFQIHRAIQEGRDLQQAVEGNWRVNEILRNVGDQPVAVGIVNGTSRIALHITGWQTSPPGSTTYRFNGQPGEIDDLLNKSFVNIIAPVRGFLQFGGGYVVVEFDGDGRFRYLRGHRDQNAWYAC